MEQNKALPYVDITLSNQDTIINLTTDELGKFAIEAKKNTYKFEINYFEEIVFQKDIQLNNSIDLGKIEIKTSTNLKEVVVGAEKKIMERKIDRFVFNVENSTSAAGGTAGGCPSARCPGSRRRAGCRRGLAAGRGRRRCGRR